MLEPKSKHLSPAVFTESSLLKNSGEHKDRNLCNSAARTPAHGIQRQCREVFPMNRPDQSSNGHSRVPERTSQLEKINTLTWKEKKLRSLLPLKALKHLRARERGNEWSQVEYGFT